VSSFIKKTTYIAVYHVWIKHQTAFKATCVLTQHSITITISMNITKPSITA